MSARRPTALNKTKASVPSSAKVGSAKVARIAPSAPPLGGGAHFAKLSRLIEDDRYEAVLLDGRRVAVRISPDVDVALADRCLADQEMVLVGMVGEEVLMFGALRTREIQPAHVVVDAAQSLMLRSGKSRLELRADGRVRITGDQLTIDAPREVRIASAHVELP